MNNNSSAKVHPTAAADTFWVMGDKVAKRGKLEGTEFNVVDVLIPPGSGTPPHTHASPEIFRILEGTVRIWSMVGGTPVETDAVPGDVVTIPAHAPHAYQNVSPYKARQAPHDSKCGHRARSRGFSQSSMLFPGNQPKAHIMKKYLVAAVLVAAFAGPALAEQFYGAFDPASHKCTMMHSEPAAPMKSMGAFKTEAEAHKAMTSMKECQS